MYVVLYSLLFVSCLGVLHGGFEIGERFVVSLVFTNRPENFTHTEEIVLSDDYTWDPGKRNGPFLLTSQDTDVWKKGRFSPKVDELALLQITTCTLRSCLLLNPSNVELDNQ